MNRMDDFLKKRLEDFSPADDGWNMPSDELFDKAKVHFPKKKKKKRWGFFILPGLMLLALGFYLGQKSMTSTNVQATILKNDVQTITENKKVCEYHLSSLKVPRTNI